MIMMSMRSEQFVWNGFDGLVILPKNIVALHGLYITNSFVNVDYYSEIPPISLFQVCIGNLHLLLSISSINY